MRDVPKTLKALIGTEFDKDSLYEAAAWKKIRLCKVFRTLSEPTTDLLAPVQCSNLSHYFTGFSRLNLQARPWYARSLVPKEYAEAYKLLEQAQKRLEKVMPEGEITEEKVAEIMAELTGQTMEDMEAVLEKLQEGLDNASEKLRPKLDSGRIYPWDHIKFKVSRINLRELPQERYRGPALKVNVDHNGIITKMSLDHR